jgi:polysaccharide pyruvyl transferase WcaK-like protein
VTNPLITCFDNGSGVRFTHDRVDGYDLAYRLCGVVPSRRIYHRDSLWRIRTSGRLGGLGHAAIDAIRKADAVLDCTSGDSFTDLYSHRRFRLVTWEKLLVLEQGRPLILLPQTIGPFAGARAHRLAGRIARAATMAWARDDQSFATLHDLLAGEFDPDRHRCGVDLAFSLEAREPSRALPETIAAWLSRRDGRPLIGFNVSGLILNDPHAGSDRFRLRAAYRHAVTRFLEMILAGTDANILLVPHVVTDKGHFENDPDASEAVVEALGTAGHGRVACLGGDYSPSETKWIIGRTDWFCGTRMHSAIAALSSGVPAAAMAYSPKHLGIFRTCGQGSHVADLREMETREVVDQLWRSWSNRHEARLALEHALPAVLAKAERQMDEIVACCAGAQWQHTTLRRAA